MEAGVQEARTENEPEEDGNDVGWTPEREREREREGEREREREKERERESS